MLSRRSMLMATELTAKEELTLNPMTDEVIYDGLNSSISTTIVKMKPVQLGKKYLLTYDYYLEILDIQMEGTARHDFSLRYTGAFGYTYSIRIHANHGIWPSPIVSQGRFEAVLTCTLGQTSISDLLKINILDGKVKAKIWNISLTEV